MTLVNKAMSIAEMPLINGNFDLWPDNTSLTAAGKIGGNHSVVSLGTSGAATISQQTFTTGQTAVPGDPIFFLRWNQTTAATAGTPEYRMKIEDVRTFAGKKICIQGFYRSNTAFDIKAHQDFGAGGSPTADVITAPDGGITTLPITSLDSTGAAQWNPFTVYITLPSLASLTIGTTAGTHYLGISFRWPLSTTFQVDLADIRVHAGGERIPVQYKRPVYDEQRLLERYIVSTTAWAPVSTQSSNWVPFRTKMAIVPTMTGGTGSTLGTATVDGFPIISAGAAAAITAIVATALIAD